MQTRTLCLLIICGILSEGFTTLTEENFNESSDLHVRKKRVINTSPTRTRRVSLRQIPYMVNVYQNGIFVCGGSILSSNTIITAAHCIYEIAIYNVFSDTLNINSGIRHNVTSKIVHRDYRPFKLPNDLALLKIFPLMDLNNSYNRKISIYNGPLPQDAMGTISGWGCTRILGNLKVRPKQLQAITVPIIGQEVCRNIYKNFQVVTNREICTFDGKKSCSHGDSGGPLVVDDQLVGVSAWRKWSPSGLEYPDVFVNLLQPVYRNWINAHIPQES